jgi:glycopeptide antibiotics resistance protein
MIFLYLISIVFAIMSLITNNLGQLIAAMIIAFVATLVDRVGR